MLAGGAIVYFWNPPRPKHAPPGVFAKDLTFLTKPDGLYCAHPELLAKVPLLRIVDGDTAMILWEDEAVPLRYYGVNTTEKGQRCSEEGTDRNRALSDGAVRLAFDERRRDIHNRLLAYVFTDDGRSIDAQLVAEGIGKAWRRDGFLRDRIAALEDQARSSKTGCLWSGDPVPDAPHPHWKKRRVRS